MKNLLLSVVLCFAISFSFSQSNTKSNTKNDLKEKVSLKKNTVKAVDFLTKNLQLDSKQKAIFMNAYSEYANTVSKAKEKVKIKQADNPTMASKKQMNEYVLRFTEKRNNVVMACLKKKQLKKFTELQKRINPMTLEVRPDKKK